MNHDTQILSMLLRFAQRRMIAVLEQVYAHVGDAQAVASTLASLERAGLLFQEGPAVRLTMPGFAHALALAASTRRASVHPLRRDRRDRRAVGRSRSHAA